MKAVFSITRKKPGETRPGVTDGFGSFLSTFAHREDGGVAILVGLAAPVLLGFAGLGLEYSQLLVVRAEAQRTADLSSHAGAAAYARTGDEAAMRDAGQAIARLNGFADGEIVVLLDTSFPTASGAAVRATITTPKALFLPRILGSDAGVDVVASAVAGALGGESSCIQALDPNGSGVTLSGGVSIQSNDCGVASNAKVEAPCGTSIITKTLTYDSNSLPVTGGCNTIVQPGGGTTDISRRPTTDPLAGSDPIALASAQLARTAALTAPGDISVGTGPDIHFAYNQNATKAQAAAAGCTATYASGNSEWTFSCPGRATVNLGNITVGGGIRLRFNPGAAQSVTYNLSGSIRNTGTRMVFAGGTYNVAQGIITGGGSVTEFGAGTYRIGRATQDCQGARFSICNTSELTFGGPSDFVLPGGVRNTGGSKLTLGAGSDNSFRFGPSSGGDAISIGGGSQTVMGDATGGGVFEVAGRVDGGGGGSCMVFPAADLHEIKGPLLASGAIRFGAGLYAIDGHMHLGGNGGGSANCGGETISVEATDTTFMISANGAMPNGWECTGQAFCVSAGYSNVRFTAPKSGPFKDMAVIGPLDPARTSGAKFAAGAGGSVVSGAFYFPNGPITMSGGASASGGSGDCLQMIGAEVTLSGGTSIASECDLPQSGGSGRVVILR